MFGTHINTLYGELDGTESMRRLHFAMCLLSSSQGHWVHQSLPAPFASQHMGRSAAQSLSSASGALYTHAVHRGLVQKALALALALAGAKRSL